MGRIKKPRKCSKCNIEFGQGAGTKRELSNTCAIECPYCHHLFSYTCGCQYHTENKKFNKILEQVSNVSSVDELDKLITQVRRLKHG